MLITNSIYISKIEYIFKFQRTANLTDSTTMLGSELRELVRNSLNVMIQKICLQLGNLGLNWGQICPKNYG